MSVILSEAKNLLSVCVILSLGLVDTNTDRLTAALSGAFSSLSLDGRQPICASRRKNLSKIARCEVRSSFPGAPFR